LVSTVVRVKNLRGLNADVKFELIGEHQPEPVFLASKTYAAGQTARDPIAITIQPAVWEGRTGKQYVRVRLVAGPEELYSSKLTRAK